MSIDLWLRRYRSTPVTPVVRETLSVLPETATDAAPVLCVSGDARGAAAFGDQWLRRIADRGRPAHALSVRGQGETPKADGGRHGRVHDVVQAAVRLPRRAVLIGHDRGAVLVAHAIARYPVAAAVFVAPRGLTAAPAPPVGNPRVLVAGSPDDSKAPEKVLEKAARAYDGAPLLFPGMGHDFMTGNGWQASLDAILDWLDNKPD